MDEQLLVEGCVRGEAWAQKKLYELYAPLMMTVCLRYAGNKELARDWMHDGFIKVFTKIHHYAGTGSFAGWIRRTFVTTALEHLRRSNALKFSIDMNDIQTESHDCTVLERLSADELLGCVAQLPPGFRIVFNMYAIEGYSHAEIAGMLHINEGSSRSQYTRARQMLQRELSNLYPFEYKCLAK